MPTTLEITMARSYARKLASQYRHTPQYYSESRSRACANLCAFYSAIAGLLTPAQRGQRDLRDIFEGTPAQRVATALLMLRQAEAVRGLGTSAHDNVFYAATASLLPLFDVAEPQWSDQRAVTCYVRERPHHA